jgi:hypothetical protein
MPKSQSELLSEWAAVLLNERRHINETGLKSASANVIPTE